MDKNRAKRVRRITVDGVPYTWLVSDHNHDGDAGLILQVWKNRKLLVRRQLSSYLIAITPKFIEHVIRNQHETAS